MSRRCITSMQGCYMVYPIKRNLILIGSDQLGFVSIKESEVVGRGAYLNSKYTTSNLSYDNLINL